MYLRIIKNKLNQDLLINLDSVLYIKKTFYQKHKICFFMDDGENASVAYASEKKRDQEFERLSSLIQPITLNKKQ